MLELGLGLAAVFSGVFAVLIGGMVMGLVLALLLVPYFLFTRESQSLPAIDAGPIPLRNRS